MLTKSVTVVNGGDQVWNRLLHVGLGRYLTDARPAEPDPDYPARLESPIEDLAGQTRGFSAYIENQFFVGLAHPAGFALFHEQELVLRQVPGRRVPPTAVFFCHEAVYGVSAQGDARRAFRDYLRTRMRRVVRGHDKPLAIFEPFGAKPDGSFWETEEFVIDNLTKVVDGQRNRGLHWDYYSIDFWHDSQRRSDYAPIEIGFREGFPGSCRSWNSSDTRPGCGWTVAGPRRLDDRPQPGRGPRLWPESVARKQRAVPRNGARQPILYRGLCATQLQKNGVQTREVRQRVVDLRPHRSRALAG